MEPLVSCTCAGRSPRCARCVAACLEHSGGIAFDRGVTWAKRTAAARPAFPRQPWPTFEGRVAELARAQVAQMDDDERRLDALALRCWEGARWWWEARQPPGWELRWEDRR